MAQKAQRLLHPVRDLDIGRVAGGGQNAVHVFQVAEARVRLHDVRARGAGAHDLRDLVRFADAKEGVHLRQLRRELLGIALGEAPRDDERLAVLLFVLRHLQDRVDGLLLGGLDEAAGIDDDGVRLFRVGFQLESLARQHAPASALHPRGSSRSPGRPFQFS